MNEEGGSYLDSFDNDNGEKLDIKKKQDTTPESNKNQTSLSPSSSGFKIAGYFFLAVSVGLFIAGALTTPWLTLAGGICCLISLFFIGAAMYQDYQQSKITNNYIMNNDVNTLGKTKSIENGATMMAYGNDYGKIPSHNTKDLAGNQITK